MADTPKYSSIIDEFLSDREPNWKDLGLKDAKESGDEWLDRTHGDVDEAFMDEIADGASKHTPVPPTSKGATLQNRLMEKENAAPRLGSGRPTSTRNASHEEDYRSAIGDDKSLMEEVTESLEAAASSGKVEKKDRSDAEIKNYVKQLLNQGVTPAKVAAKLKQLSEVVSFNPRVANEFLQKHAGILGMVYLEPNKVAELELYNKIDNMSNAYLNNSDAGGTGADVLEPNTFMDGNNPNYERTAKKAYGFNSQSELKQMRESGGVMSQIRAGDRVTIVDRFGKEQSGRAVMFGPAGWVLNMGGRHGTPAIANEENIVKVRKAPTKSAAVGDVGWAEGENTEEKPTPVIFRKWKDTGDIMALFPYDLGTDDPYTCSSYEHVGQHSAADPHHCIQATTPCTPDEYAPLKAELESLGYKLKPMNRLQYKALEERRNKLKQYFSSNVPEPAEEVDPMPDEEPLNRLHTGSSQDCVRQAKAWKSAGITLRAKSVKQITACEGCTYFKKNGGSKTCGLYGLPVVSNAKELTSIVNRLTAGVPASSKKAALVQIANRTQEQNPIAKAASSEAPFVHQSSFTKERQFGFAEPDHFSGSLVQKLHTAGHSLKAISEAADKKYGALETSKGIREFLASLRKEKGKIIMAKADADYLKKIGIHNEAIVGATKCASCKSHNGKEVHKSASTEMVTRAPETFVESTLGGIRASHHTATAHFDSASVAKLHAAGHNVDKIFKAASAKYGSAQASKAVRDWANNLKNTNTKIALSQIDCTTLKKMGVKLSAKNAILGAEKCGSCSYRNGMHCGLTGGTLLSFPGMNQVASKKKVAAGAPEDGRSILKEFDLMEKTAQADIDMKAPDRAEVQMGSKPDAGEI